MFATATITGAIVALLIAASESLTWLYLIAGCLLLLSMWDAGAFS